MNIKILLKRIIYLLKISITKVVEDVFLLKFQKNEICMDREV